jgi:hypothetical protein
MEHIATEVWDVMTACVIMHSMIVEDERDESIHDKGRNFKVNWLPRIQRRLHLRSSSICTKRLMITLLMINCRRI